MSNEVDKLMIDEEILGQKHYGAVDIDKKCNVSSLSNSQNKTIVINDKTTTFDLYKGMLFMCISCICFSGTSICSKILLLMKPEISSFKILTYRTFLLVIVSTLGVGGSETNIFDELLIKADKIKLVFLRSCMACITIGLLIYSIKYMDVSDVYTIFYCYPVFVILMSLFTKDKPKCLDYFCLVACIIGALLIIRPAILFKTHSTKSENMFYFLLALCAAFSKSLEMIIVRNIKNSIHFLFFPLIYSFVGLLLFPLPLWIFDSFSFDFRALEVLILCCMCLCTWGYHAFMALSLGYENVGRASMINYFQIPLLLIVDLMFFNKAINFMDITGAGLIFSFNMINGYYKLKERTIELDSFKRETNNENDNSPQPTTNLK